MSDSKSRTGSVVVSGLVDNYKKIDLAPIHTSGGYHRNPFPIRRLGVTTKNMHSSN